MAKAKSKIPTFLVLSLIVYWFILLDNVRAASPYIYNCSISPQTTLTQTPTPLVTPGETATPTQTPVPTVTPVPTATPASTVTPTPTTTLANSCIVGSDTINKGEGLCDEKTDTVTLCEGGNQMVQKPNFCGVGQVCRSQAGSYQIKCDAACQLKMGSGSLSKADLVVLAEDYDSYSDFLTSVDKSVGAINRTNLGSTRLGKINLWALLDLNQTYFQGFNCPSSGGTTVACWDYVKAATTALTRCGGDVHMIFNNDTHRTGSVAGIAVWGSAYIYRFALDLPTVPHELGHAMAGLSDEYSFGIPAPAGAVAGINCSDTGSASQATPCPKWLARFPNVGCYQRCGYTNFYRPMDRSIMDRAGSGAVWDFNEPSLVDGWDEVLKFFP